MTAKEHLQQIYILHKHIERLKYQREQIRAEMYSLGSPAGKMDVDKVQTSLSGDNMLKLIGKVDAIEKEILDEMDKLLTIQVKIVKEIEQVQDEQFKELLHLRYVQFKRWEEIAVDMSASIRHIHRLHGEALRAFDKDVTKCH